MHKLNPHFFVFSASADRNTPEVKNFHFYGDKWKELAIPKAELGGIKTSWPSCIGPAQSGLPLLLKENVVRKIEEAGLTGLSTKEVEVIKLNGKKSFDREVPKYYWATAPGILQTHLEVYKRTEEREYIYQFSAPDHKDPEVVEISREFGRYPKRIIPHEDEWGGMDFFVTNIKRDLAVLNCTRRFVDLVYEQEWDNFSFNLIDSLSHYYGDFRDLDWPPETWYPEQQKKLYD